MKTILLKDLKCKKEKPSLVTIVIKEGLYDIYQSYYWDDTENDYIINGDNDEEHLDRYSHLFRDFNDDTLIIPKYMEYTRIKTRKTKEEQETERLNNIINEIKKLKHNWQSTEENEVLIFENNNLIQFMNDLEEVLDKLQELKGEDKE